MCLPAPGIAPAFGEPSGGNTIYIYIYIYNCRISLNMVPFTTFCAHIYIYIYRHTHCPDAECTNTLDQRGRAQMQTGSIYNIIYILLSRKQYINMCIYMYMP